jgi:serine/threonine-protein kinase HipA
MVERLCESVVTVGKEVIEAAKNEQQWRHIAKYMVHAWNEGMASVRSPKQLRPFRGLDMQIAKSGFSEPEPPVRSKEQIGASELLARPQRRR